RILDLAREMIRLSGLEPDKDIPIVFTEPRPGEKFFEEILMAEEGVVSTQHQKIFMAKLTRVDKDLLNSGLEKLKKQADSGDKETIIKILKELIPSYG
ncbi:MAG: nucleoside-diphosphate sugar epimerase, partial [Candidatus Nealsonbacteria bacterium CG10_big_fil_rev_8_21_14_0_10_37_25]